MHRDPSPCIRFVWILVTVVWVGLVLGACRSEEARVRRGRRLFEQARFQKAEQALAPLFAEKPPSADSTNLLYGRVLLARGELQRARDAFHRLLDHSPVFRNAALYGLARAHFYLGHPDTARSVSRRLLRRSLSQKEATKPVRVAQAYHVLGRVDFYEAHYDRALTHQRKSLRWARRAQSRKARADALRQIGVLHWYEGRVDSAKSAFYEPALRLYRQVGDSIGVATTLSNIGLLHWQKGQWRQNARYQLRAFAMRKRMGNQIGLADSYAFLAQLLKDVGLWTRDYQLTYLRKSLRLSRRIGYAWGEQVARQRLKRVVGKSLSYWDASLFRPRGADFRRSGEHRLLRRLQTARRASRRKEWQRAARLFARVHRLADSLDYYNFQHLTLAARTRILVKLGRWDEAMTLLRRIEAMGKKKARPWTRDHAAQIRATIALHRGDSARAAGLLRPVARDLDRRFLNALHETAPEVAFETAVGAVHGRRASVYGRLVEALKAVREEEAFRFMERERALPFWGGTQGGREARERFSQLIRRIEHLERAPGQEGEIQKLLTTLGQIRQEQLTKRRVLDRTGPAREDLEVTSRAALQRTLRRGEVFVEYFVREKQHHVFVARRDSSRFLTISVPRDTLANTIDVYRSMLRRGREHPDEQLWRASGRRLFDLLLRPLIQRGWITPNDHLLIAPHRRLWGVPFHALPFRSDGDGTRFLIERTLVSYVRSATDLVERRSHPPRRLRSVLAVAPVPETLPHTKQEVDYVRSAPFERERVLLGEEARAKAVREAWPDYDVVHLAAHAQTNERFPLYSPLHLGDERIELYEVLGDSLKARLVVLSACETGRSVGATGRAPTGASVVSFPRAFLRAGAASVVGSLWRVDDAATARLVGNFYRELAAAGLLSRRQLSSSRPNAARSLAGALTRAQRTYLERARQSDRPTHPFYWAGFVLIGDGR